MYLFCQDLYILLGKHSNIWSCNGTVYTNKGIWIFKIGFHSFLLLLLLFFFFGCKVQTEPRCSPLVFYFFFLPKGIRIFKIWKPNFFFINFFIGERERERERERCNLDVKHLNPLWKKKKESWCWTFWFSFVPKKKIGIQYLRSKFLIYN